MIRLQGSILSKFPLQTTVQESKFWIQNSQNASMEHKLKLITSKSGRLPDLSIKSTPKVVIGIYKQNDGNACEEKQDQE